MGKRRGSETGGCESSNMGKGVGGKGKETLPSNEADAKAEEKGLKIIFGLILLWSESGGCESRREGGNYIYNINAQQ